MTHLNQPLQIKDVLLTNRLVLPPMATSKSTEDGRVSEALLKYYEEKTQGGYIGLVITEHAYVSQSGKASPGQLSVAEPGCVEGLTRLAKAIHANGAKAIAQINHAGRQTSSAITGAATVGPSAIAPPAPSGRDSEVPRALTAAEIQGVIADFANAARHVKQAGFDGVEIHSAHGYLLNQFYSPLSNQRTDAYTGATLDGRLRIHLEVIRAVREAVGGEFLVALRLGGCDYQAGGSTIEDSVSAAILLEKAGIDLLDITGGLNGYVLPGATEQGYFAAMTAPIKRAISMPVILTGGVTDGAAADHLLADGKADLIGVGRAMLKDSQWAKSAFATA